MNTTTVELELERERDELKSRLNAIAFHLSDIAIEDLTKAERNIFAVLCDAGYMRNLDGIAIWLS